MSGRVRAFWKAVPGLMPAPGARELTRDELYVKAKQLEIHGRSRMTKDELAEAVRTREETQRQQASLRTRLVASRGVLLAALRRPIPVRPLVLSLAVLAAGAVGLLAALAIASRDDLEAQLLTGGQPLRIATVTGPGGATTVALARTKGGETKTVPVRIVRTVTGPSRGALRTEVLQLTDTEVVTRLQPVTVVVTATGGATVTETVVLEVTTTVPAGQTKTKTKTKP